MIHQNDSSGDVRGLFDLDSREDWENSRLDIVELLKKSNVERTIVKNVSEILLDQEFDLEKDLDAIIWSHPH